MLEKFIKYTLFLSASFITLTGCREAVNERLIIGTNSWQGYEPLYLAEHLGYYPGKSVKLAQFLSTSDVMKAFRNGTLHGAAVTLDEAMTLADEGFRFRIVAVLDISAGADAIVAKKNYFTPADLKGKRIGAEQGALGAYMVARALETAGLSENDAVIVPVEPGNHKEVFVSGKVDAVACYDPVRFDLVANHGGNIVFDSASIPGEILDVLIINEKYISTHKTQIRSLLTGWAKTVQPEIFYKAENLEFLAERLNQTVPDLEQSLSLIRIPGITENYKMLYPGYHTNITAAGTMKKLGPVMKRNHLISPDADFYTAPESFIDDSFIKYLYNNPRVYRKQMNGVSSDASVH